MSHPKAALRYIENVTGAGPYTITHNLNILYPVVEVWNRSNNTRVADNSYTTISNDASEIEVSGLASGLYAIIVHK